MLAIQYSVREECERHRTANFTPCNAIADPSAVDSCNTTTFEAGSNRNATVDASLMLPMTYGDIAVLQQRQENAKEIP